MAGARSRRGHRIRIYGRQRANIDAVKLANILILLGRDMHHRHVKRQQRTDGT
jgi:hypothetical protein